MNHQLNSDFTQEELDFIHANGRITKEEAEKMSAYAKAIGKAIRDKSDEMFIRSLKLNEKDNSGLH